MKYIRFLALTFLFSALMLLCVPVAVFAENSETGTASPDPGIVSNNALVAYCIDDDQFLYANRLDEKVAPTVATKLVACMVASDILKERGLKAEDVEVTVTATAVDIAGNIFDVRVPVMGFKAGNVYTAKDLLSATLVACANDAVASIACDFGEKYLGGGVNEFVARMNQKVKDLGLENTHFKNPTGLDSANQYTTPREVALIAAAFYQYDELVSLSNVESFFFNGSTTVRNKNYLKSNYYVDGFLNKSAIGLIAGQLDKSGNYCLITAGQKEGRTYIFVVMCASGMIVEKDEEERVTYSFGHGNAYADMNKLISWTRESFKLLTVATTDTIIGELRINSGESDHVMIVPGKDVEKLVLDISGAKPEIKLVYDTSVVYKKEFNGKEYDTIDAPVSAGQKVGTVTYSFNGYELATVDAVVKETVNSDGLKSVIQTSKNFLFGETMMTILYVILGIIGAWLVIAVIMAVVRGVNRAKASKNEKDNGEKTGKSTKTGRKSTKTKPSKETDDKTATKEMRKL